MKSKTYIRLHAEEQFAKEITALVKEDKSPKPANWKLSPEAVLVYILGGKTKNGITITPKYFGQQRLVELAIATLLTDRALLLIGVPGTAKTWLSEHLTAAITGNSTLVVQGTSGTGDDAIRYGWNYARLLQEGPSKDALVPSPVMRAMETGCIVRVEELTRIPSDIQDSLITILSEKSLPIPELNLEVRARKGFNLVATANDRDKGIHDLSSALQRRFNTVRLPLPASLDQEVEIVSYRVAELNKGIELPQDAVSVQDIRKLVTVFRELRSGATEDGKTKIKSPSGTLSTAEAISAIHSTQSMAYYFASSQKGLLPLAESIVGTILKDKQDRIPLEEYVETQMKTRKGWKKLYEACQQVMNED